jgi:hypothetical protein
MSYVGSLEQQLEMHRLRRKRARRSTVKRFFTGVALALVLVAACAPLYLGVRLAIAAIGYLERH